MLNRLELRIVEGGERLSLYISLSTWMLVFVPVGILIL